jgi:hypothetical protein
MRGRLYLGILAGVIGFGLLNTAARAQSFPMEGKIVSASANLSLLVALPFSAPVYTTPNYGNFILTQFCAFGLTTLSAGTSYIATTGNILPLVLQSADNCYSFKPGFALPRNQVLTCTLTPLVAVLGSFCSISGILEDEK